MMIRCPCCGAEQSLDVAVSHEAARAALSDTLTYGAGGGRILMYLGLFRPAKRTLTWARTATLLAELLPAIHFQRLTRDGRVHEVPREAWWSAIDKCLEARDAGTLRLPLKSHGYLFEIAISEAGRGVGLAVEPHPHPRPPLEGEGVVRRVSATAAAVVTLEERKRRNHEQ